MMNNLKPDDKPKYFNTGKGPNLQIVDIVHKDYCALIDPDSAFWALLPQEKAINIFSDKNFIDSYENKRKDFMSEMAKLRFASQPSAVYFNPTELCNLNCTYCYIPEDMRRNGRHMSKEKLAEALNRLKVYFNTTIQSGRRPQIIFHGSEPMLNREAVFYVIEQYADDFMFGIQTNATLLDKEAIDFVKRHELSIGVSLDGHVAEIANKTRKNWAGTGVYDQVVQTMENLAGYKKFSVICTLTKENITSASDIVEFFHKQSVEICLLNILRCTQPGSRNLKPDDEQAAAEHFIRALEHTYRLYQETGRKIIVANFANILLSIVAPTARRLMCDISPCGGGRCFFAVSAKGDVFPCSEFIGLDDFICGNLFQHNIEHILQSANMQRVTSRKVENIDPCKSCAIKHFCGAPCPAEAFNMHGGRDKPGAFCRFYEDQVRYAFRLIVDKKYESFLYDNWDMNTQEVSLANEICLGK
jgi:uncharacterized protein